MAPENALQHLISVFDQSQSVDGIIGLRTASRIRGLATRDTMVVQSFAEKVLSYKEPQLLSSDSVSELISEVSSGNSEYEQYLELMVELENKITPQGVFVEYAGTFKGIAQFNRETWVSLGGPSFEEVVDTKVSLQQALKLYLDNQSSFRTIFGPGPKYTKEIAYLYHNQGASSAARFLDVGVLTYPGQSNHALMVFDFAKSAFV